MISNSSVWVERDYELSTPTHSFLSSSEPFLNPIIQKDTCTAMFTAAQFTIAGTWKQLSPSTDEWIKKKWEIYMDIYIYTHTHTQKGVYITRNKTGSFVVMWMDLESIIQSEVRKKKINIIINADIWGFPDSTIGKESACNAGDPGLIPGLGRSPGEGIGYLLWYSWASLVAQLVKYPPAMWETWVQSPGWEDPVEKGTATYCSILA